MTSNQNASAYADVVRHHLNAAFPPKASLLASYPGVDAGADGFRFTAFGRACRLSSRGVFLDGRPDWGPRAVIIALLARHATPEMPLEAPWRAFRELPDSAPYVGAFRAHSEQLLVPHIPDLYRQRADLVTRLGIRRAPADGPGDWTLILDPLPKIALCYHLYLPDDDFPANATCLFSTNAHRFLPTDALADVGEYTSRALIAAAA